MQTLLQRAGAPGLRAGLAAVLAIGLLGAQESHAQPKAKAHTIVIEAMQFSPATLEVRSGDTVTWQNKDAFPHTVTADKKGVFPYACTLHPSMKATLIVK